MLWRDLTWSDFCGISSLIVWLEYIIQHCLKNPKQKQRKRQNNSRKNKLVNGRVQVWQMQGADEVTTQRGKSRGQSVTGETDWVNHKEGKMQQQEAWSKIWQIRKDLHKLMSPSLHIFENMENQSTSILTSVKLYYLPETFQYDQTGHRNSCFMFHVQIWQQWVIFWVLLIGVLYAQQFLCCQMLDQMSSKWLTTLWRKAGLFLISIRLFSPTFGLLGVFKKVQKKIKNSPVWHMWCHLLSCKVCGKLCLSPLFWV